MEEPIHIFPIHNLPESLILQCLARLHLKDLPNATRVCRKWLHLIGSRHFYIFRKQLGYTNHMACLYQECSPPTSTDYTNLNYRINVFDPMNREWNRLPPIPNFTKENLYSSLIASSEGKLVMFCDDDSFSLDPVKCVFVLDFATLRWRKGKNMPLIGSLNFSMVASQCQRVFISGEIGRKEDAVWEYDVWKDEWTVIHRVIGEQITRLQIIGEELRVIFGSRNMKKLNRFKERGVDVYHLQTQKWSQIVLAALEEDLLSYCSPRNDFELDELLKKLCPQKVFQQCFRLQLGKQSLLMAFASTFKNAWFHDREELFYIPDQDGDFERMQPFSSEFSGYVVSCCCVEL